MAINHSWIINRLDCWKELQGNTDVVCNIHFGLLTTNDEFPENSVTQNGAVAKPFNPAEVVVPYAELTEEIVIGWILQELKVYQQDELGALVLDASGNRIEVGDTLPTIEAEGERQLEELIHPKIVSIPLPWLNV